MLATVLSAFRNLFGGPAPAPPRFALKVTLRSTEGPVRTNNEDRLRCVFEPSAGNGADRVSLVVVADGMGGHQAGEVAAETTVDIFAQLWRDRARRPAPQTLEHAARTANATVYAAAQTRPDWNGMGTTIAAIAFDGSVAHSVHVGDTRIYRLRTGTLERLTEDDSLVNHWIRQGRITAAEADNHPDRGVLSQALGTHPALARVHLGGPIELAAGDIYLLATDGLHDVVTDAQIAELLATGAPSEVADRLLEAAVSGGTQDNITVALVAVDPPGARVETSGATSDSPVTVIR